MDLLFGKRVERADALDAAGYERVVVDVGAGDGRWIYRLARAHPTWLCVAVDADAAAMRATSWRARRKPARGGAPNAVFLRMAAEALPDALERTADEVHVQYPWGSLLRAVTAPGEVLSRIARVGKAGALLRVMVNASALGEEVRPDALRDAYEAAGVEITTLAWTQAAAATSWGRRVARDGRALVIEGTVGRYGAASVAVEKITWNGQQ